MEYTFCYVLLAFRCINIFITWRWRFLCSITITNFFRLHTCYIALEQPRLISRFLTGFSSYLKKESDTRDVLQTFMKLVLESSPNADFTTLSCTRFIKKVYIKWSQVLSYKVTCYSFSSVPVRVRTFTPYPFILNFHSNCGTEYIQFNGLPFLPVAFFLSSVYVSVCQSVRPCVYPSFCVSVRQC